MRGFVLLCVLLLSGYKISTSEAIAVGENCVTNGAIAGNPADITQYYYCMGGKVYLGSCAEGRYFDSTTFQCVYSGTGVPGAINCNGNDHATFPYPGDNSKYYYCLNGQALVVQCPVNTYYNEYSRTCTTTSGPGPTECLPGQNVIIPTGCHTFILCMNGVPYPQSCPNGQYFHPPSGTCGTTVPSGCNTSSGACASGDEGKLQPVKGNCSQYMQCVAGKWITTNCPPGYYFSPVTFVCGPSVTIPCAAGVAGASGIGDVVDTGDGELVN